MRPDPKTLSGQPVIIGGGVAGLMTALRLAPEPVVLVSKGPIGTEASSAWAQGGLAASLGADDDPALHLADTLAAGDGWCDAEIAARITRAAPLAIETLVQYGVNFDRSVDGTIRLGLEAAHSRRRIVHAAGDGTGRELMRALAKAVRNTPSITVLEGIEARRLLVENNAITGVLAADLSGGAPFKAVMLATRRVVLATGGIGGLFLDTTNPQGCFGQGLALAARAGADLADLEFIQFHPTALDGPARPMALISEAVRGEGAWLIDETGNRFLSDLPGAELGTRDAVARGVFRHLAAGHRVFLDARQHPGPGFADRFPGIAAACRAANLDPALEPIPVRPAAHYHMGGVAVDGAGRSSVEGLWACGEVARTGLHGANRLASNSLIEAVVCAGWVAESVTGTPSGTERQASPVPVLTPAPNPAVVRPILSRSLGVLRDADGLREAVSSLLPLASGRDDSADPAAVALMIAIAAWCRTESRGAHYREDFPQHSASPTQSRFGLADAVALARELAPSSVSLTKRAAS